MDTQILILTIIGIYLVLGSLILVTDNLRSTFLFKVLPFVFGITLLIIAAMEYGVVFIPPTV